VKPGAEADHDQFVNELRTPASADLLRKYSLVSYAVFQRDHELEVVFKSEKPEIIAGFLKNKRFWPEIWEFTHPGEVDVPADKPEVFRWSRD
jgi:hypothetical protein